MKGGVGPLATAPASANNHVHVLSDGENCTVYGQQMHCDSIDPYLRDTRRVPFDRPIFLLIDGTHDSQARGRRVAELIARTGYSKTVGAGFITEPGKSPGPNNGER